jgi:hypothetical protein
VCCALLIAGTTLPRSLHSQANKMKSLEELRPEKRQVLACIKQEFRLIGYACFNEKVEKG